MTTLPLLRVGQTGGCNRALRSRRLLICALAAVFCLCQARAQDDQLNRVHVQPPTTSAAPTSEPIGAEAAPETGPSSLKIHPGTQSGTTFRLRDKGMPNLRGGRQGDQLVRVHVEVPASLTAEQRKILEDFARVSGDAAEPTSRTFFEKAKKFF